MLKLFCKARLFIKVFKPLILKPSFFLASFPKVTLRITEVKEKNSLSRSTASQQFYRCCPHETAPCAQEFNGRHPTRSPGQRGFLAVPTSKTPVCLPNPQVTLSATYLNETVITYFYDQQQAVVVCFFPKLRKIMSEREILKHTALSPNLLVVPWD